MFKIGDFSKLAQVSTRMLRHYDKIGLLIPNETDQWTGYRYYTIDQLPRLHRIVALKDLGFTLEQITDLLQDDEEVSTERLKGMLALRQREIEVELAEQATRLRSVAARLDQIEQTGQTSPFETTVKSIPSQVVAGYQIVVPHSSEMGYYCQLIYERLYDYLDELGIEPGDLEQTLYYENEFKTENLLIEATVPVADSLLGQTDHPHVSISQLPQTDLAASIIFEGKFIEMNGAILELLRWAGLHKYTAAGPLREVHLSGRAHIDGKLMEPAVLELLVPIKPLSS